MSAGRPDGLRLVSVQDLTQVGLEIADKCLADRVAACVEIASQTTGKPVRVHVGRPYPDHHCVECGAYVFNFPGDLSRIQGELIERGVNLVIDKDVLIQ